MLHQGRLALVAALALAALALATPAPAQFTVYRSSPAGFEFNEGGGESRDILGSMAQLRFQQIDATNVAPMINQARIAFRRDGRLLSSPEFGARTLDLEIAVAEGDIDNFTADFAANIVGNHSVVVPRTQVNLPDWSAFPPALPAPRDFEILFATPWSYGGKGATGNDLLWEVRVYSNSAAGQQYPFDYDIVVQNATFGQKAPTRSGHFDVGRGCAVALGESHLDIDIWNHGTKFVFDAHLHTAPFAPVALNIGLFDANISHPLLCSKVHVVGGINMPVGVASANGDFDILIDPIPYHAFWIGIPLYFQSVAPDQSQAARGFLPVALSSASWTFVPEDPRCPVVGRVWADDPNATQATVGPLPGGIITHFGTQ